MATTSLRLYLHDIEGMVGAGQTDEAIAHCRHILQTFPKSIAVYRLLGKAYLESQRYSDAADVLQRVLSAVPDDFISHVGMSMIREDEDNLDASIWHMERAFETQPYNSPIQDELRRLYGRRDGMEPPKIRLTRGALARLYIKGNLYQQAIGELRAALAEDPQRVDLQGLLARGYYMAGQRVEAVETCSTLLKKLPYCLDANILLGAILPETERAQDAQNYRQRAISLEPYFSQAASTAQTADNVPASAVTLEKLVYSAGKAAAAEEGQPAWATSLGVSFEKDEQALPDWLGSSTEASTKPEEEPTPGSIVPFNETGAEGNFPWEPSAEETTPTAAEPTAPEAIPDWMKDAGWSPSSGTVQEGPLSFGLEDETAVPVEGALAAAEIPDWLREAAPPGILDHSPASTGENPADEELPWLQETPPGPSDTIVTWLNSTKGDVSLPAEETPPTLPTELFPQLGAEASETEIPDWLKENAPPAKTEAAAETTQPSEIPDWLQTAEPTVKASSEEELPDWLKGTDGETPAVQADLPDWLKTDEETPAVQADLPDWLKTETLAPEAPTSPLASTETLPTETGLAQETPVEIVPEQAGSLETPAPAEEFPAWLKEVEAEIPDEAVETPQLKGVTEWLATVNTGDLSTGPIGITDWLSKVEPDNEPPAPVSVAAPADDIPEWLKGIIAAKQTETVDTVEPTPATPAEEIPEWLKAATVAEQEVVPAKVPEGITPPEDVSPAVPVDEIPDWMKEIEAGLPGTPAAEVPEEIVPAAEAVPGEGKPAFEGGLPPGVDLSDQDAALAWLEGLAAKQGVPEEEFITKPEERTEISSTWAPGTLSETPTSPPDEEMPDWMREVGAEEKTAVPQTYEEIAPAVEVIPAAPAEEIPDWLKAVEAEVPEGVAPAAVTVPTEAAPAAEGGLPAGLDLSDSDATLAWLEGLAAKQGVPEEELMTKPEDRAEATSGWALDVPEQALVAPAAPAEEVPDWLKAVEAEVPEEATPIAEFVPAAPAEEIPDWLKAVEAEVPEEAAPIAEFAPAAPVEEVPDWLKAVETEVPEEAAPTAEFAPAAPVEEVPDWLKAVEAEVPEEAAPTAEFTPAAPVEELPDWLKAVETEVPEEAAPIAEFAPAAPVEEVPDWLKAVEAEVPEEAAPAAVTVPTEAAPAAEGGLPAGLDLSDSDATLAWLEGLAAKQGVPEEELMTKPEDRAEATSGWALETPEQALVAPAAPADEVPDWLKAVEAEVPEEAAPTAEFTPAEAAEEVPDWLKAVEAEVPEEAAPIAEFAPAAPVEEVPDWLKAVEAEVPEEAAPAAVTVPTEAAPAAEGGLPAGLDLSDSDATLAWLEGLAAKQGVPEEELMTKPEDRAEATSGWALETPEQALVAPAAPAEEAAPIAEFVPAAPVEELPDWLKAIEAEVPEETAPSVEAVPVEAARTAEGGLPAGLDLSDQDAALAWLEGLAAKQGVPEAELITKPEDRAEVRSSWAPEVPEQALTAPAEEIPDWLKTVATEVEEGTSAAEVQKSAEKEFEFEAEAPVIVEATQVEIPSQPIEWIKETELTQWQEKTEVAKPDVKAEPEAELPNWIADVAAQDSELAWVPSQIAETEENIPPRTLTNLNSASVGELERLPGIGFVLAQSLINHRDARGPFKRIDDLLDVPGIGPETIEVLKDWITIQPAAVEIAMEEEAAPLDPDHFILKQAQNALQQGDIPTAIRHYEKLLKKLVLLNEIALDLQDALYRHPVEISIWQALGDAYMRNNQLQDALDAYTKAEELLR